MPTRQLLTVLLASCLVAACAQPSQKPDERPSTQSSSESEASTSDASFQRFMKNTIFRPGDAPTEAHSCKRFSPRQRTVYLPPETYQLLESGGGPREMTREQYLQFMHGFIHAKKWHGRVEAGKENSDHSGMSYEEIVIGIQRYRMEKAGSPEAFIQKRLGEELEAKQAAWEIVDEMKQYDAGPISESRLTDEEKQYHRQMTRKQIETFTKEFGSPF